MEKDKKIIITGGTGFLGEHLYKELLKQGYKNIEKLSSLDYDLTSRRSVLEMYDDHVPNVVIHLAAVCGGIGANRRNPGSFFYENILMGTNVIHEAMMCAKKLDVIPEDVKIVFASTICAYPKITPVPFEEKNLWNGYPEETNAPYAIAKKSLMVMLEAYNTQYGLKSACVMPTNLYGPGDNFSLEDSHVIPALIRKFLHAKITKKESVECWGDGSPSRDFLYAPDAANGIIAAMENIEVPTPINLGSGQEVRIKDLTEIIAELCEYEGKIVWDTSKPNGQPRRCLSNDRARELLGWHPTTELRDGLKKTIKWYKENMEALNA